MLAKQMNATTISLPIPGIRVSKWNVMMNEGNAMIAMLLIAVSIAITAMIKGVALTRCGFALPPADDFRVFGGISVAIMVGVLVTFLYIIHIYDLNPEYRLRATASVSVRDTLSCQMYLTTNAIAAYIEKALLIVG